MSTKENVAIERRIEAIERAVGACEPIRFRTVLQVFERGPERRCSTIAEVRNEARKRARPVLAEVLEDLDCLIDAESGVHVLRHEVEDQDHFDAIAERTRLVEVPIACHRRQVSLIRSCLPLTESRGGARAGKTRIGLWWTFRQVLLRGHDVDEHHDEHARFWWIREDSEKLYQFAVLPMLQLWPPEIFTGKPPGPKTRHPVLRMIDGSEISFRHANFSGSKAGTNLRSANVEGVNVDEKSAILNQENWREILNRVSQTGGPVATQTTPAMGHWSDDDGDDDTGGLTYVDVVTRWENPWITHARLFADMVKEKLVTATELEEKVLTADDQVAAASALILDPDAQRAWLGRKVPIGLTLWREWRDTLIVKDSDGVRASMRVEGHDRPLPCITAEVLGQYFRRDDRPRPGRAALGQDFNVNPCAGVIYQIFGELHRPATWHVLAVDEVATIGPTSSHAAALRKRYPGIVGFCDPSGAMPGRHESHGPKSSTDAAELLAAGIYVQPAAGREGGKAKHLPQKDGINVLHHLMRSGQLLVHARCARLIEAMRTMRAKPDGTIDKVSGVNSKSDQVSAFGDALRYGVFRPFAHVLINTKSKFGTK